MFDIFPPTVSLPARRGRPAWQRPRAQPGGLMPEGRNPGAGPSKANDGTLAASRTHPGFRSGWEGRRLDDLGLARAARDGDPDAFMWLVRGHQARVRALAYGMLGDRGLAEDVAQEAFLRAWRGIDGFRGDASFSTWLYSIARRVALEVARKRTLPTVPLDQASPAADPAGIDPELRGDLERAIAGLEPAQREAFLLVAVLGLSYAEVSQMIGIPTGTVGSRVFRARERLAAAIRVHEEGGAR